MKWSGNIELGPFIPSIHVYIALLVMNLVSTDLDLEHTRLAIVYMYFVIGYYHYLSITDGT